MNKKGFSLTELMVVTAVAGVISLFSFESVKQVIQSSVGVRKKADFNSLVEEVRGIANKLDQCTCNFLNFNVNSPNAANATQAIPQIRRFTQTQAQVLNGPTCQGPMDVLRAGEVKYETQIDRLELRDMQYLAALNLFRGNIYIEGRQQKDLRVGVRMKVPVMFSTEPNGAGVNILGCIGMTE